MPAIHSLKHLSVLSGVEYALLRAIVERRAKPYREIVVPKSSGGHRILYAPQDELMALQRWVLHEVLLNVDDHPNNFAYKKKVTALECAEKHVGANWMVKADIHNYFPSVREESVFRVFEGLNYSRLVSFELARLCTWPIGFARRQPNKRTASWSPQLPYQPLRGGRLPQGAPTSGALANAATVQLDQAIALFAEKQGLVYTRYSDDIVISGSDPFDRQRSAHLLRSLGRIVTASGYSLHEQKSRIVPPGARKVVLGMLIHDDRVRALPERRRRVDAYIHGVRQYGLLSYSMRVGFDSGPAFINHVDGWLSYLGHIEPDWVDQRRRSWDDALALSGIDLTRGG